MIDSTPNRGKIGSLPNRIREQLNHRLLNGEVDSQILPWLNALPEVEGRIRERFDGIPISAANLSNWRTGPFQRWQEERKELEAAQSLCEFSAKLADAAGLNLSAGMKAIATGRIMARLQKMGDDTDLETLLDMVKAVSDLHAADVSQSKLALDKDKAEREERRLVLDEQKFRYAVAEQILKAANDTRVKEIAAMEATKEVQMDLLIDHIWGKRPEASGSLPLSAAPSPASGG